MNTVILGFGLVLLAGILNGSFGAPMKKTSRWAWENTWVVWACVALMVLPWAVSLNTVRNPVAACLHAPGIQLARVVLFGVLWGIGGLTFGISLSAIGISLGFAIGIGLTVVLGTLIPMAKDLSAVATFSGQCIAVGLFFLLVGIGLFACAGRLKSVQAREQDGGNAGGKAEGGERMSFGLGLVLCIVSGVFMSMMNLAFSYSGAVKTSVIAAGATEAGAADAVWALILLGGFLPNAIYCSIKLTRNGTWANYRLAGTAGHWGLACLMGLLWFFSVSIYGRAAVLMGKFGDSAGWAVFLGTCILTSNFWGIASGEWRGPGKGRPFQVLWAGMLVLLLGLAIIGYGILAKGRAC